MFLNLNIRKKSIKPVKPEEKLTVIKAVPAAEGELH